MDARRARPFLQQQDGALNGTWNVTVYSNGNRNGGSAPGEDEENHM